MAVSYTHLDAYKRQEEYRGFVLDNVLHSENAGEIAWVKELHPDCEQYWETYEKYGLWKPGTLMAHCVHSDERERAAMAKAGVWAVHCAASNVNSCSGTAPVRRMLEEGVSVALGSDIAGGDQLAMSQVVVTSIRASKVKAMELSLIHICGPRGIRSPGGGLTDLILRGP